MSVDVEDVKDMVAWARSRIRHCRRLEVKFEVRSTHEAPSQILIDAQAESRTLRAVLSQIGIDPEPGKEGG